jgi:citrate lyase beta subunit
MDRIRTALFTPGTEAARLRKAVRSGSDVCIFDLEDSVPAAEVAAARETVAEAAAELAGDARVWVRVHDASDPRMVEDVQALPLDRIEGLVLPKVSAPEDVSACLAAVAAAHGPDGLPLLAIIENASGVLNAHRIACAPGVSLLALGRFDLAAEIGIDPDQRTPALAAARALVVLASTAARLAAPLDSPWLRISDLEGLVDFARSARREGFGGMLLIHPSHVAHANQAFAPAPEEIAWAREVVDASTAAAAGGRGAFAQDGRMVDEAIVRRARGILRQAGEAGR